MIYSHLAGERKPGSGQSQGVQKKWHIWCKGNDERTSAQIAGS
jgi:hypothetical protein